MNKTSIKIIKRKDARVSANLETRNLSETKLTAVGGEKLERNLHRKMADTISSWIAERRENKRTEETSAFRKLFGDEFLSSNSA